MTRFQVLLRASFEPPSSNNGIPVQGRSFSSNHRTAEQPPNLALVRTATARYGPLRDKKYLTFQPCSKSGGYLHLIRLPGLGPARPKEEHQQRKRCNTLTGSSATPTRIGDATYTHSFLVGYFCLRGWVTQYYLLFFSYLRQAMRT